MRKVALLLLSLLVALAFTACDDDRDYQHCKATTGLKEATGTYDEEEDGPRNWEYELRMLEEQIDEAERHQAELFGE